MGYFRVAKFSRFCLKRMGIFFAAFNFRGRQRPRKIILILFRDNSRGKLDFPSIEQLCGKKVSSQSIWNATNKRYLPSDRQTNKMNIYLHSNGWIKWLFRTKQWNICLGCLLRCALFAIKLICNNDYGVNIGQVTSSRLCRISTNLRILSEIYGVSREQAKWG